MSRDTNTSSSEGDGASPVDETNDAAKPKRVAERGDEAQEDDGAPSRRRDVSASRKRILRSGSTTPAQCRLPSRPTSPSRLRSLPSVGVSNIDALSDAVARLELEQQQQQYGYDSNSQPGDTSIPGSAEDELEDTGRAKEAALPAPKPVTAYRFTEEPLVESGISDYTFIPVNQGGLLGRGKFSSVQLAWKNGVRYAVKVTPLYPHHNLIATRLLREPTILAQLPLHPNLVRVHESIRTSGHFYLVEEYLDGYTNLENFVSSQTGSKLTVAQAMHIYHQLVSVVRSALHEPIQIAHRDIKPENVLIHPITLRIILLDFGLATHFSAREPRLTTCCGSPAFHAPELVLSLRSAPGSVRYWGPEIDIWTIGVTLLRCLTGVKYPLGVQHTSLQHLADKTMDAVLSVQDREFRRILAGLLDMDGDKRMEFFRSLPAEIDRVPYDTLGPEEQHEYGLSGNSSTGPSRNFKTTTFIPTEPKHTLPLVLASPPTSTTPPGGEGGSSLFFTQHSTLAPNTMSAGIPNGTYSGGHTPFLRSRSQSRDRLTSYFTFANSGASSSNLNLDVINERLAVSHTSTNGQESGPATPRLPELLLLNPESEPPMRAISFVKYALRCAGIVYHIQSSSSDDLSQDRPSWDPPKADSEYPVLHCVRVVPKSEGKSSPAASLLSQLRPPMSRAATSGPTGGRSVSTPPSRLKNTSTGTKSGKKDDSSTSVKCLEFWIQIIPVFAGEKQSASPRQSTHVNLRGKDEHPISVPLDSLTMTSKVRSTSQQRKRPKSKSRTASAMHVHTLTHDTRKCTKIRLRISDETAVAALRKALEFSKAHMEANGNNTHSYAMYATPPPGAHIDLPGETTSAAKAASRTTNGQAVRGMKMSSNEQDDEPERGRPKISRSQSSNSRSPPGMAAPNRKPGTAPSAVLPKNAGALARTKSQPLISPTSNVPLALDSQKGQPSEAYDAKGSTSAGGIGSIRIESEETDSLEQERRGFFDFADGAALPPQTQPAGIATAPTTPQATPPKGAKLNNSSSDGGQPPRAVVTM